MQRDLFDKLADACQRNAREVVYSFEKRKELREQEFLPILADLEEWMKQNIMQVMPKRRFNLLAGPKANKLQELLPNTMKSL